MGFAFTHFSRNKGLSVAAIFVLTITILLITGLFFMQGISKYVIEEVQNRIDITAKFKEDTTEEEILQVKQDLLANSGAITSVEYVSKEQALEDFNRIHGDNPVLMRALQEVGQNPLLPALNIVTDGDTSKYEIIATILEEGPYAGLIEEVDFLEKKAIIEKVFSITSGITNFGIGLGVLLLIVAILVVFNTIKLIIEASGQEISTMRIVGASNWFIRAPFVIQGVIFGSIAFLISFTATIAASYFLSPGFSAIMPAGFNLFTYFTQNALIIIIIQLGVGVGLGSILSLMVVGKYLKI